MPQNAAPASTPASAPLPRSSSKVKAIGIVIPATNRSGTIAKCVFSLFAANSYSGWRHSLRIVVVADACTDDTAKEARNALGAFGQVLEVSARSLSVAYRIGESAVIQHFRHSPRHSLLITSVNAGIELSRDWINEQLRGSHSSIGLSAVDRSLPLLRRHRS